MRATLAVCVTEPLVPLIVSVELLAGLPAGMLTVNVELPDVVIEAGLKEAVAPDGNPLTDNPTVPVNEPSALTFTV